MGEEIAFENGRISDFEGLVTLTLDRVILHTFMHQSRRADGRTFEIETHFIGSTWRSDPDHTPFRMGLSV